MGMGIAGLAYQAKQPPVPQVDIQEELLVIASPKIKLRDGRFLAYTERGVPMSKSNYKIIIIHGFASSKEMQFLAPQEVIDELGIYFLLYDRAGYGESDPNPKRSVKSEAHDVEELADYMQIGSKFYVIGVSMGSYPTWGCLQYISHRLAGVALVVPVINYEWPSLAENMKGMEGRKRLIQFAIWIAKYAPGILYWWLTEVSFPRPTSQGKKSMFFSQWDMNVLKKSHGFSMLNKNKIKQKSIFESLRRDFLVGYGRWEFDPMNLTNPYPKNESNVHIWQGQEDKVVPVELQRHVSAKLPWIQYHEVPEVGHLIVHDSNLCDAILRALLPAKQPSS